MKPSNQSGLIFLGILVLTLGSGCSHQYSRDHAALSGEYEDAAGEEGQIAKMMGEETEAEAMEVAANTEPAATNEVAPVDVPEASTTEPQLQQEVSGSGVEAQAPAVLEGQTQEKNKQPEKRKGKNKKRVAEAGVENAIAVLKTEEAQPVIAPAVSAPVVQELNEVDEEPAMAPERRQASLASAELSPLMAAKNQLIVAGLGAAVVFVWFFLAWRRRKKDKAFIEVQ